MIEGSKGPIRDHINDPLKNRTILDQYPSSPLQVIKGSHFIRSIHEGAFFS